MGRTGRYRWSPIFGTGFLVTGVLLLSQLTPDSSVAMFSVSLILVGLGMGSIFPVVTTAVRNALPREMLGTATAAGLSFRQVGGSLAVGALFAARLATAIGEIGPQIMADLPADVRSVEGCT